VVFSCRVAPRVGRTVSHLSEFPEKIFGGYVTNECNASMLQTTSNMTIHILAIISFWRMAKSWLKCHLVAIGDGSVANRIEERISLNISHTGHSLWTAAFFFAKLKGGQFLLTKYLPPLSE
jgi:hypothetical protein